MNEITETTTSDKVKKYLEQQSFLDANADDTLTEEDKASSVSYDDLSEDEKHELNEIIKSQLDSEAQTPISYKFIKSPRKPLTQKQLKARKKKKKISNASRKANRKK